MKSMSSIEKHGCMQSPDNVGLEAWKVVKKIENSKVVDGCKKRDLRTQKGCLYRIEDCQYDGMVGPFVMS